MMDGTVGLARPFQAEGGDNSGAEEPFVRLLAILDHDGGLMPANRDHPLWALWHVASSRASTDLDLAAFRSAYASWLAQRPILLK